MVGNVNSKLRQARELLHQLDIAQDLRSLSDQEAWLRRRLKQHCLALASFQRTIARVRSSICWLQDGDANTAYFHSHARYRKRKNFIAKLQVDGNMVFSQEEKEQAVWDFYNGLLGTHAPRATAIELSALDLPSHDLSSLDHSHKVPGSTGSRNGVEGRGSSLYKIVVRRGYTSMER